MNHLRSTLSSLSAVAALGLAACGGSHSKQANTPPSNEYGQAPNMTEQYGSAMGQPAPAGTEPGAYPPAVSPSTPTEQGGAATGALYDAGVTAMYDSGSSATQYGAPSSQYGPGGSSTTTTMGSPYGASPSTGATSTMGGSMMGGSMDVSTLTDAQLAAVLQAINTGEIQQAQLAESRAQSPEVKRLAQHMMTAHQNIQAKGQAMLSRLQITPSDNAVSQQIQTDAQNDLSSLQSMRGREFDRDYVQGQIKAHNQAIEMIDRMIPTAKSPEFKTELMNLRPKLQAHLQEAERVQAAMQKGTTNKQGGSY
jgi:putative membrane protein